MLLRKLACRDAFARVPAPNVAPESCCLQTGHDLGSKVQAVIFLSRRLGLARQRRRRVHAAEFGLRGSAALPSRNQPPVRGGTGGKYRVKRYAVCPLKSFAGDLLR